MAHTVPPVSHARAQRSGWGRADLYGCVERAIANNVHLTTPVPPHLLGASLLREGHALAARAVTKRHPPAHETAGLVRILHDEDARVDRAASCAICHALIVDGHGEWPGWLRWSPVEPRDDGVTVEE